ncbi:MAG: ABC transporter ATP-binding protein [Anaerolineae bacterium]|nr:ABC transporter ATP-binding protein [Anaerolineae bacterium]
MDIQISHLTKNYGSVRALDDVSLTIKGGMYGLLGPNGAGKSTLMKILATLLPPTSGSVTIGAYDLVKQPGEVRQNLGYLPQDFGFYRSLNAYQTLDYIATMKNIPANQRKAQIERLLEQVNLTKDARRRVGGYSGGMRQRLGIAQALMGDPALLIVDEPTAGLDPEERIRFRNLLARLSGDRTVLLSTHIVADIEASCVGVAVINQGKLVFNGTPDELVARAKGLVWQIDAAPQEWEQLEQHYSIISSRSASGSGLQVRLIAAENPFGRGVPAEASLEDGYMAVMSSIHAPASRGIKEASYA